MYGVILTILGIGAVGFTAALIRFLSEFIGRK